MRWATSMKSDFFLSKKKKKKRAETNAPLHDLDSTCCLSWYDWIASGNCQWNLWIWVHLYFLVLNFVSFMFSIRLYQLHCIKTMSLFWLRKKPENMEPGVGKWVSYLKREKKLDSIVGRRPTAPPAPKGLYIYGNVGTGTCILSFFSILAECLCYCLPVTQTYLSTTWFLVMVLL